MSSIEYQLNVLKKNDAPKKQVVPTHDIEVTNEALEDIRREVNQEISIYPVTKTLANLKKIQDRHVTSNPRTFIDEWAKVKQRDAELEEFKRKELEKLNARAAGTGLDKIRHRTELIKQMKSEDMHEHSRLLTIESAATSRLGEELARPLSSSSRRHNEPLLSPSTTMSKSRPAESQRPSSKASNKRTRVRA